VATTRTIEIKTDIPGPRSAEILARKERVIAEPLSIYLPLVIADGRGATVTDVDGNTYVDFAGGVGCMNVGHSHPRVVEAIRDQAERFTHTDFTIVPYENYVGLAERLLELAPISGETRAGFFNSGAEAIENSIKFARAYTKRPGVIAFEGGFHGRTLLALSLTSKTHPYKVGLGPFAPETYRVPFDDLEALEYAFKTRVAAEDVAAIVLEPVQGEGGFVVPSSEFVQGLRRICDERGIVFVADEVQTGFCRTGKTFAIEHFGVDAIAIARNGQPNAGLATAVAEGAARRGLLLLKAGIDSNCNRVLVPLVVEDAELAEALDVWEDALTDVAG
jgi:4-aminobutyrate aminotransferase/(S)-3-amino-2-methylpropionate transaminase